MPAVPLDRERLRHLRAAGNNVRHWTEERDRLIREAIDAGGTLREIGAAVGLSHQAVKLIGTKR